MATDQDRLKLSPAQVSVEVAKTEIKTRMARLSEIERERASLREAASRDYVLQQEVARLKGDIHAYERVIGSAGGESFEKASRRADGPSLCAG